MIVAVRSFSSSLDAGNFANRPCSGGDSGGDTGGDSVAIHVAHVANSGQRFRNEDC